jgi:hypothetical protein
MASSNHIPVTSIPAVHAGMTWYFCGYELIDRWQGVFVQSEIIFHSICADIENAKIKAGGAISLLSA